MTTNSSQRILSSPLTPSTSNGSYRPLTVASSTALRASAQVRANVYSAFLRR